MVCDKKIKGLISHLYQGLSQYAEQHYCPSWLKQKADV